MAAAPPPRRRRPGPLAVASIALAAALAAGPPWRAQVLPDGAPGVPIPPPPPAAGQEEPEATFGETIDVRLATFVVRVVDGKGEPVRGLGAESFDVRLGDEPVEVVAVDWVSSGSPGAEQTNVPPGAAPPSRPEDRPGRLIVLFVQADFNALRIHGHLKMLPFVRDLLAALPLGDRVALVSFDSHLKLWRDFTTDRAAVHDAVYRAVRFGNDPPRRPEGGRGNGGPSLAAGLDPAAAKDAPWVERGLELVAEALAPLPGEKAIVFLGWGLGRYGFGGFRPRHGYWRPAVEALGRANATVFVLDVTDAGFHTLELGLRQVAAATGGTYDKTAVFPLQATRRLARLLSGHYLLTVDAGALVAGDLDVQLVGMEPGVRLLVRPVTAVVRDRSEQIDEE